MKKRELKFLLAAPIDFFLMEFDVISGAVLICRSGEIFTAHWSVRAAYTLACVALQGKHW